MAIQKTIVAVGEALWDVFPDVSLPGGAPCNLVFHAARLGDRGVIVSRVGNDTPGAELIEFLSEGGVVTDFVQSDSARPTGAVRVTLEHSEPRYKIVEDVAWDHLAASADVISLVRSAHAVCVGSLAQRNKTSRATIQRLLAEAHGRTLVIFDVNLRPPYVSADVLAATLHHSDVVKMSDSELQHLSGVFEHSSLADWLIASMGVQMVCVTRGRHGASITTRHGTVSADGVDVDTTAGDAVGAGDAFTAALTHQLIRDATPEQILHVANRYAGLIASKKGAMSRVSQDELARIGL